MGRFPGSVDTPKGIEAFKILYNIPKVAILDSNNATTYQMLYFFLVEIIYCD